MEPTELRALVEGHEIDTVIVAFTDAYGRNLGKRCDATHFLDQVVGDGSHGCDYLLTVDMEMEPVPGYTYANWEGGYGDFHLVPDLSTLRPAAWAERTAIVLCDVMAEGGGRDEATDAPVAQAPRSILRRQIEAAAERGLTIQAASELEFFLYDQSYRDLAESGHPARALTPAGWYSEDYHLLQGFRVEPYVGAVRRSLAASGIPVETSKGETGRGQHELNIRYAEALEMADRHTIMKQAMKEIAETQGRAVTFMAKPFAGEAGNSCHIHLSATDGDGRNVFDGDGPGGTSDRFRWFLGGWMLHLPELMPLYAPTVNSYKRYEDGSWAPTRLAWSRDNRTAGFRIVGSGAGLRIECRIPGGDVNPYLAFAAAIASGLDGIERQIEPPPELHGDAYTTPDLPLVARSLDEALVAFDRSGFATRAFKTEVVEHYRHFYQVEADAYRSAVTDWERIRYFERI